MKSVLVTGASGGVGCASVRRLSMAGWEVFAAVRSLELAPELAALAVEMDITDQDSLARACETIAVRVGVGGLQGLVNNAGLSADGPLEIVPVEALRRQFEVNVIGQVGVTQAFLPLLRQGGGRVINIGGAAGRVALPMYGALSASKAALDSLSEALRMELKHQGEHVSYINPERWTRCSLTPLWRLGAADGCATTPRSSRSTPGQSRPQPPPSTPQRRALLSPQHARSSAPSRLGGQRPATGWVAMRGLSCQ